MKTKRIAILLGGVILFASGCRTAGVPDPIKVLANPATGQRERFFPEIWYKVPANYDQAKHLRSWTRQKNQGGFTVEISPEEDRAALAELRRRNLAKIRSELR